MSGAAFHRGASRQDYETPWELIEPVEQRFGPIVFDLAASPFNTKAPDYFTETQDSLAQDWHKISGLLWLNPPFAHILPWARKCADEKELGAYIAFLVPAAVGSAWFANYVHDRALVLPLRPRLSFDGKHPYPKDVMLCMYGIKPGFEPWKWR